MHVAILSSDFDEVSQLQNLSYENRELLSALRKRGDKVYLVAPCMTNFGLIDDRCFASFGVAQEVIDVQILDALLIRRTRGAAERIFDFCCYVEKASPTTLISDPITSLVGATSKILPIAQRSGEVRQPSTQLISSLDALHPELRFPLVAKPLHGRGGIGVSLCSDILELEAAIATITEKADYGVLVQEYIEIELELRVAVAFGKVIGCVSKPPSNSGIARNISNVSAFEGYKGAYLAELEATAIAATSHMGYDVAGVDVAVDSQGNVSVIECNRSPQFQGFDEAMSNSFTLYTTFANRVADGLAAAVSQRN